MCIIVDLFQWQQRGVWPAQPPTCGPTLRAEKDVTGRTLRVHAGSMAGPPSVVDQGASLRLGLTSRRGVMLRRGVMFRRRRLPSARHSTQTTKLLPPSLLPAPVGRMAGYQGSPSPDRLVLTAPLHLGRAKVSVAVPGSLPAPRPATHPSPLQLQQTLEAVSDALANSTLAHGLLPASALDGCEKAYRPDCPL